MNPPIPEDYISFIGTSFLQPITSLIESFELLEPEEPNEVQASSLENGYSVSIIILTVLMLESAIGRTQYIRGDKPPLKPIEFVRKIYPDTGFAERIEELFVVRDVIAHNHIWEKKISWDNKCEMRFVSAELCNGSGDKKYKRVIDIATRTTRLLRLNVIPTKICRTDFTVVLRTAVKFLQFLEKQNERFFCFSQQPVGFQGDIRLFTEVVASLYECKPDAADG